MGAALTDRLCTKCALCCDGSLFADVELAGAREAARLEAMGLDVVDDDGGLLELPCGALRGSRCGVYAHRPECCRTFECRLLQDVRQGVLDADPAEEVIADVRARIRRLRRLAASLGPLDASLPLRELCLDALTSVDGRREIPGVRLKRSGLATGLDEVDELVRKRFLGIRGA